MCQFRDLLLANFMRLTISLHSGFLVIFYIIYICANIFEFFLEHVSVPEPEPIVDNRVEEHVEEAEEGEEEASKSETEEERNQSPEDSKGAEGKPLTVRIQLCIVSKFYQAFYKIQLFLRCN